MSANTFDNSDLVANPDSESDTIDDSDVDDEAAEVEDDADTILGAPGEQMIEITVRELLSGSAGTQPPTPPTVADGEVGPEDATSASITAGFQFGKPIVSFGPVPWALYDKIYADPDYSDPPEYEAVTGADTADLRHLWRRLGFAKEPGAISMRAKLSWEMDAFKCSAADMEALRPILERYWKDQLPALSDALLA